MGSFDRFKAGSAQSADASADAPVSGDLADDPWQGLDLQNADGASDVADFDGGMDGGSFDV